MKQEDVNTIVDRCINDFNFDCVLTFFAMFGDTNNPKFWLNVPTDVTAVSLSWRPLSGEGWLNIPTHRIEED